jgi:uncharacterized membrane protein
MNTPRTVRLDLPLTATPLPAVPESSALAAAWGAYGLHALGLVLPFVLWPSFIALLLNYLRRGRAGEGFLASHHRWMIRTFWWGLAGYGAGLLLMALSATPVLQAAWNGTGAQIELGWPQLLSIVAAASTGATVLLAVWFWLMVRLVRGALRLNDGQRAP